MNKMATAMQEGEYDADKPQGKVFVCLSFFTLFYHIIQTLKSKYILPFVTFSPFKFSPPYHTPSVSPDSSCGDKSSHRQG